MHHIPLVADAGGHWLVQAPGDVQRRRQPGRLRHPELGPVGFVDRDGSLLLPIDSEGAEVAAGRMEPRSSG